jgi:antitoxin PrlF
LKVRPIADNAEGDDPVLGQFLGFLARDVASHPERLQLVDASFVRRIQSLTRGVEIDLESPLLADDE